MPDITAFGATHLPAGGREFRLIGLVARGAGGTGKNHTGISALCVKIGANKDDRKTACGAVCKCRPLFLQWPHFRRETGSRRPSHGRLATFPENALCLPMVRFENVGMRYGAGPEVLRD